MKISVIHPTIRPEKAIAAFKVWQERALDKTGFEYLIVRDAAGVDVPKGDGYQVLTAPGKGIIQAANYGASKATGEIFISSSDDIEPPEEWDDEIRLRFFDAFYDKKPAALGVSDGLRKDKLLTHAIFNRARYEQQGCVMVHPDYEQSSGLYGDNEYSERAYADGVVIEARDLVFQHNHPAFTGEGMDDDCKEHNSPGNYRKGWEIFRRRNPALPWGSMAIGVRKAAHDEAFFWSWNQMWQQNERVRTGKDIVLDPATELPHAAACNLLVARFLATRCDSLLFLDDDMEFQPDDIEKLRQSDQTFDVVSGLALCRRHPHRPLVFSSITPITAIYPKDFIGTIKVGFVGVAFTLVRRWVIEAVMRKNNGCAFSMASGGEDGQFSVDAIACGAKLGVNTDVCIGHRAKVSWYWNKERGEPEIKEHTFGTC